MNPILSAASLTLLAFGTVTAPSLAAQALDLFTPVASRTDPCASAMKPLRSRAVRVAVGLLDRARVGDVMRAELFVDQVFLARFTERETYSPGHYVWTGTLDQLPLSSFIISVYNGSVDAHFLPRNGHPHSLMVQAAPGGYFARELDRRKLRSGAVSAAPGKVGSPESACSDDPDEVTILVVYDKTALVQAKYSNVLAAAILAQLKYLNDVMKASNLKLRFSLATTHLAANDTTSSLKADVNRMLNPNDNYMDIIHYWRDLCAADLVTLFVSADRAKHGFYVGSGVTQVSQPLHEQGAYSVCEWNSLSTLAHEICHNFGCQHDPANISDPRSLIFNYARGHKFGARPPEGVEVQGRIRIEVDDADGKRIASPELHWQGLRRAAASCGFAPGRYRAHARLGTLSATTGFVVPHGDAAPRVVTLDFR